VAFFLTVCLYHLGLFRHAKAVHVLTMLALGACGAFTGINASRRFPVALGVSWACGILAGSALGLFSYANYGFFGFSLANLRTYENVVPSENSAIVADAGRVSFATEAFLDQRRSVGFAAEVLCLSGGQPRVAHRGSQFLGGRCGLLLAARPFRVLPPGPACWISSWHRDAG
ncbi:unnamed protein product, partial [Symbiodinium sp. KB8]